MPTSVWNSGMTMLDYYPPPRHYENSGRFKTWNTYSDNTSDGKTENKSKISTKKTKLILTIICWTISLSGFLYQTSELFALYFSGKTIVNNGVETLKSSKIPAITICLPLFLSFEKFSQTYPEFNELYARYSDLAKAGQWDGAIFEEFMSGFYQKNINLAQMFDKIGIEVLDEMKAQVTIYDEQGKMAQLKENKTFRSILPGHSPKMCFTIFSDLDEKYPDYFVQISQIVVQFTPNKQWFPSVYLAQNRITFIVHSSNILPDYKTLQNVISVELGIYYRIQFSEIHTRLLSSPYETKCKDYDIKGTTPHMRSDCIMKCVTERVLKQCELNCINPLNNIQLIREEIDKNHLEYQICNKDKLEEPSVPCLETAQFESQFICEEICPKNCFEIFYDLELVERVKTQPDLFAIQLSHDSNPDQTIEHRPILQWLDLVSNFCGLLGMWLGLSIVFLCEYCIRLI